MGLGLGRAVVAVRERKARAILIGVEEVPSGHEGLDRNRLEPVPLLRDQQFHTLQGMTDAPSQLHDGALVPLVAVRSGLASAHVGVVASVEMFDVGGQIPEVAVRVREPLGVLDLEAELQRASQDVGAAV